MKGGREGGDSEAMQDKEKDFFEVIFAQKLNKGDRESHKYVGDSTPAGAQQGHA